LVAPALVWLTGEPEGNMLACEVINLIIIIIVRPAYGGALVQKCYPSNASNIFIYLASGSARSVFALAHSGE